MKSSPRERASGEVDPCVGEACLDRLEVATRALSSTLDLDALLVEVADHVQAAVPFDTFAVLLLDPLGKELTFRYARGIDGDVAERWRFGLGQGVVGTVAARGEALLVEDVEREGRYIRVAPEVRSELALPLVVEERTIGVLDLGSSRPGAFTEAQRRFLGLLAAHLANAIENARLFENVRQQARTLSLLHEVSRELTSILDRQELLERVAQLVKRLIDYQVFTVLLWNEETQRLDTEFMLRTDGRATACPSLSLGHGVSGSAAALRQTLRVPNVFVDPRFVRCLPDSEVRSEVAAPLVFKDRLVGVIDLESTRFDAFSEQHAEMLSTLASYLAIGLENARLYAKVRADERRLEADLSTARDIQHGLLPDQPPQVAGLDVAFAYRPAEQLAGDFFDFLHYPDGRFAVAVGDVAGKSTAAALFASLSVGLLRGHVLQHPCEPAQMLGELSVPLRQRRVERRFVAMALGLYDPADLTLKLASSGFPFPWLVRRGTALEVQVEGVPLGTFPDTQYEQRLVQLRPGDLVVFASDGVYEAGAEGGEPFGFDRLKALLERPADSAQELADRIVRATNAIDPARAADDDRTVVVLRVVE